MAVFDLDLEFEDDASKASEKAAPTDVSIDFSANTDSAVAHEPTKTQVQVSEEKAEENDVTLSDISLNFNKMETVEKPKKPGAEAKKQEPANSKEDDIVAFAQPTKKKQGVETSEAVVNGNLGELLGIVKQLKTDIDELKAQGTQSAPQQSVASADLQKLAKVMDHKITKILISLSKKHPESKADVQMIKKILNSFLKSM